MATNQEGNTQNVATHEKNIALGPQRGHKHFMTRPRTKALKVSDKYANNRQKFYMKAPLYDAFEAACRANNRSVSEVLVSRARAYIRANAPKLRKAGYKLPETLFVK